MLQSTQRHVINRLTHQSTDIIDLCYHYFQPTPQNLMTIQPLFFCNPASIH